MSQLKFDVSRLSYHFQEIVECVQPTWCLHLYCWQGWRAAKKAHKARQDRQDLRGGRAMRDRRDLRETNSGLSFAQQLATLVAIQRASSLVRSFAADLRPGSFS